MKVPLRMRPELLAVCLCAWLVAVIATDRDLGTATPAAPAPVLGVIVQADSADAAARLVEATGGEVAFRLNIINAVQARLTGGQARTISRMNGIRVFNDAPVATAGNVPDSHYPVQVGAADLWAQGVTGRNVTVAVIDSGLWTQHKYISDDLDGDDRIVAEFDAVTGDANGDTSGRNRSWNAYHQRAGRNAAVRVRCSDWRCARRAAGQRTRV